MTPEVPATSLRDLGGMHRAPRGEAVRMLAVPEIISPGMTNSPPEGPIP
jgi:hypothetical protein